MKKKKQIKIIISLLVMIAVLLGGWGLLKGNGLKAQEASIVKNNKIEQLITKLPDSDSDGFSPLVDYPGYIEFGTPKAFVANEFSFFPKWTDKTKAIPRKGIITDDENLKTTDGWVVVDTSTDNTDNTAIVDYLNAGKYGDKDITIRLKMTFKNNSPLILKDEYGTNTEIGIEPLTFLVIHSGGVNGQTQLGGYNVTYQFLDSSTEEPVVLSGYYQTTLSNVKDLSFPKEKIVDLYGVPKGDGTDEYPNSNLRYKIDGDNIIFRALGHSSDWKDEAKFDQNGRYTGLGATFDITYRDLSELSVDIISDLPDFLNGWYSNSVLPIGISSPTPEPTVISSVNESNSEKLPFAFNQVVPPEMDATMKDKFPNPENPEDPIVKEWTVDNQTQSFTWEFDNQLPSSSLIMVPAETTGFEVNDEATTDKFTYNVSSIVPKTNPPKDDSFYDQYYTFQRYMKMDYAEKLTVDEAKNLSSPPETNGNYYMKATSEIKLVTSIDGEDLDTDKSGGSTETDTWVNFASNVKYEYVYKDSAGALATIPDPDNKLETTGGSLLTWQVPLTPVTLATSPNSTQLATLYALNAPTNEGKAEADNNKAPEIAGYTFVQAKLNNSTTDYQLKYTDNNVVTLEYQPLYTVDVQVGALDTDGNFCTIPFAPPSGTSEPYVTVQETTASTTLENAISPTGTEPAAEFTFPTTYDFEVGTGKSYKVTQMENVNNDYTKPNQATSPVFLINDQNQLVVDGNVVSNSTYQGEDFILSWDATNKKLTIQIINQPNGEYQLVKVDDLKYGNVSLPQKNPGELIKRHGTGTDWKVQFTDTRLDAYRTPLKLSVKLDKNFTKAGYPTKTISGILLYRPNATTPITPDDFLIEGEEIPIKEKINPDSGTNDIDWPEQAGFLLQIDAEKQTKIFAGDYQAELTFILSEDPL